MFAKNVCHWLPANSENVFHYIDFQMVTLEMLLTYVSWRFSSPEFKQLIKRWDPLLCCTHKTTFASTFCLC